MNLSRISLLVVLGSLPLLESALLLSSNKADGEARVGGKNCPNGCTEHGDLLAVNSMYHT